MTLADTLRHQIHVAEQARSLVALHVSEAKTILAHLAGGQKPMLWCPKCGATSDDIPSPPTESDEDGRMDDSWIGVNANRRRHNPVRDTALDGMVAPPAPDARAEALEEAAQYAENTRIEPGLFGDDIAAGIRQLVRDSLHNPFPSAEGEKVTAYWKADGTQEIVKWPTPSPDIATLVEKRLAVAASNVGLAGYYDSARACQDAATALEALSVHPERYPPEGAVIHHSAVEGTTIVVSDNAEIIDALQAVQEENEALRKECEDLKHDLTRQMDIANEYVNYGVSTAAQAQMDALRKECERYKQDAITLTHGIERIAGESAELRKECEHKEGWFNLTVKSLEEAQARIKELEEGFEASQACHNACNLQLTAAQARIKELEENLRNLDHETLARIQELEQKLEEVHLRWLRMETDRDTWRAKAEAK